MPSIDPGGWTKRLSRELSAAWAIARKDMRIYYLKPNIIVSGILFPLFMFLAFATGKNAPPGTLIPGLISITLLFSAPISLHSLVSGESLSRFFYSLGIACLPIAVGVIMYGTPIINAPVLVIAMILTAFCFATLGTMFAAYPTENVGEVMSMLNTFRLPLIFISGVFIPISAMPRIGQVIALISPLTYGNDMIEYAYTGKSLFSPGLDMVMLVIFVLIFQIAANYLYKKFDE
ncbi:MAG: ABC transporter permease [Candidatus Methanoperedens sp.]